MIMMLVVASLVSKCATPAEATLKGITKVKVALLGLVLEIYGRLQSQR